MARQPRGVGVMALIVANVPERDIDNGKGSFVNSTSFALPVGANLSKVPTKW